MLNRSLRYVFNVIYVLTIVHGYYTAIEVLKIRGIYQGDLPEKGREFLDFYSSHPVHGILNMAFACFSVPVLTMFCLLGMGKEMQSDSLFMNILNMSIVLCCNCFMLSVHEWVQQGDNSIVQ